MAVWMQEIKSILSVCVCLFLASCGGSDNDSKSIALPPNSIPNVQDEPVQYAVTGVGVKGPLQHATVNLYKLDANKLHGFGELLATGNTNKATQIEGLSIEGEIDGEYIIEFQSNDATIDITTGQPPTFTYLTNVVSATQIRQGELVYATPLSTLVSELTIINLLGGDSFSRAHAGSVATVESFFSFGLTEQLDIVKTPPILTAETVTEAQQQDTLHLRMANEATAVFIHQLFKSISHSELNFEQFLLEVVHDLVDGKLNGVASDGEVTSYTESDVKELVIPLGLLEVINSNRLAILRLKDELVKETAITEVESLDTSLLRIDENRIRYEQISMNHDIDNDGIINSEDEDDDNDGVADFKDQFRQNYLESRDFDNDGIGDNADLDDDNDGIPDYEDNITVSYIKSHFTVEESVLIWVRGLNPDGKLATDDNGWHVQYHIYDMQQPDRWIIQYGADGYYNGSFDSSKNEWLVSFPTPPYEGDFEIRFVLYCSKAEQDCDDQTTYFSWEQVHPFTVSCADQNLCEYTPAPEPGVNISQSDYIADYITSTIRSDGKLFVAYRNWQPNDFKDYLSVSTDRGKNWSVVYEYDDDYSPHIIIENNAEMLVAVEDCGSKICVRSSQNGSEWNSLSMIDVTEHLQCTDSSCGYSFGANSLIESQDGEYLLTYSFNSDVYLRRSSDLIEWTDAITMSDIVEGFGSGSTLFQQEDGTFILVYLSEDREFLVVTKSDDGTVWTETQTIASSSYYSRVTILNDNGTVRLFFSSHRTLYSAELNFSGQFDEPVAIKENLSFGAGVILLDNKLSLIYEDTVNNKGNVFFETIENF
ncbi:hypothetical protein [Alteromonas ponticola]|uniref:Exo-alpha-sialidase n=1 Tax=Alteromonas ponticola TaxID=2720613 RepID=A0ABX1R3Z6_9ALTE|nr:hypothetical protein [Alteromonas ponticola]NMH60207.1 hypothetical protein [Alteromonas ponticola]